MEESEGQKSDEEVSEEKDGDVYDGDARYEEEEESEEAVVPKALRDPRQPTQRQREEHDLTHLPPRAWCWWCNGGRIQHDQHRTVKALDPPEESAIPCISLDYCFMGNRETLPKDNPVLVVYDNRSKSLGAWQVYRTGAVQWVGLEVCKFIDALGYKHCRVVLKSDGEVSITALKDLISTLRAGPTVTVESPARESKCNGAMEVTVKSWQSQFRTYLLD